MSLNEILKINLDMLDFNDHIRLGGCVVIRKEIKCSYARRTNKSYS